MSSTTRSPLLLVLAVVLGIEALGVSGYTVWFGAQLFVAETGTLSGALFLLGLFILCSAWLWVMLVGLIRVRPGVRAPAVVWQTTQAVVGISMINAEGDWWIVAVVMIVLALGGGVLLFTPSVSRAIARHPKSDAQ